MSSTEAIFWNKEDFLRRFSVVAQVRFVVPLRDDVLRLGFRKGNVAFEGACQEEHPGVQVIARRVLD